MKGTTMWTVHLTTRPAVCQDCGHRITAYEPRVDWSTEGLNWEKGNIVRRYCLKCGMKRMKAELSQIFETIVQGTRVWNMIHKRYGWPKAKETEWPKVKWPKDMLSEEKPRCRRAKS